MPANPTDRFQFEPYAGPKSKATCPSCDKARKFTRYIDTETGEVLPNEYGRCDRQESCGYFLSPYTRPANGGDCYAWIVKQEGRNDRGANYGRSFSQAKSKPAPKPAACIPPDLLRASLSHYERNAFVRYLRGRFGLGVADELLTRFPVGTSAHWSGACVFWFIDERGRVRAGKVMLYDEQCHRVKEPTPHITWVDAVLRPVHRKQGTAPPAWLADYKSGTHLFGLHQLATAPANQTVAVAESEKTAIVCSLYFPAYTWMATGGESNLKAELLEPLRGRRILLFPDAGKAFINWQAKAAELKKGGYNISVSDALEKRAALDTSLAAGLDLADVLLREWPGYPPDWDAPGGPA